MMVVTRGPRTRCVGKGEHGGVDPGQQGWNINRSTQPDDMYSI